MLRDAEYQLGHVPEEPVEEWTSIVTDAHRERFYKEVTRDEAEVEVEVEVAMARTRAEAAKPRLHKAVDGN
ncbi:hypothetical protein M2271_001539 [Streptomyces sp. LBL]|uniref:hypothetical protein n=1 Tax=Streptomyces sp. LBL TaxID=2940562 RepID=UPI002474398F|nr:hypothetical protein [Streptomyces sp. LBL]MDH6623747.1 hypothetical protein [Streptomyces sp. LBL]